MLKLLFLYLFIAGSCYATQFVPVKIEGQLQDADAVLHGVYQGSSVRRLPYDQIVTVNTFRILEVAGIEQNEIFNLDNFEVYSLGGTYNGRRVEVSGNPHFYKGEEVVLLLAKTRFGWTFKNLALGKYQVVWENNHKVLKSSVFPNHPVLGHMLLAHFRTLVIDEMGQELVRPEPDRYIDKQEKEGVVSSVRVDRQRSPASVGQSMTNAPGHPQHNSDLWWLALILGCLGCVMTWYHHYSEHDEEF